MATGNRLQQIIKVAVSDVFGKHLKGGFPIAPLLPEQVKEAIELWYPSFTELQQKELLAGFQAFLEITARKRDKYEALLEGRRIVNKTDSWTWAVESGDFHKTVWVDKNLPFVERSNFYRLEGVLVLRQRVGMKDATLADIILPNAGDPLNPTEDELKAFLRAAPLHRQKKVAGGKLPSSLPFPNVWTALFVDEATLAGLEHSAVIYVPLKATLAGCTDLETDKKQRLAWSAAAGIRKDTDGNPLVGELVMKDAKDLRANIDTAFGFCSEEGDLLALLTTLAHTGIYRTEPSPAYNDVYREAMSPGNVSFVFKGPNVSVAPNGKAITVGGKSICIDPDLVPFPVACHLFIEANGWSDYGRVTTDAHNAFKANIYESWLDTVSRAIEQRLRLRELSKANLTAKGAYTAVEYALGLGRGEGAWSHRREMWNAKTSEFVEVVRQMYLKAATQAARHNSWTSSAAEKMYEDPAFASLTPGFDGVDDATYRNYFVGTDDAPGFYRYADTVLVRSQFEPALARRDFGRKAVTDAIDKNSFGKKTCANRALVMKARVSAWNEVSEADAVLYAAGKKNASGGFTHFQLFRDPYVTGDPQSVKQIVARTLLGVRPIQRRWFARSIGDWQQEEMTLTAAKQFRREQIRALPRAGSDGEGFSVHVVRGYPLWPKWLGIGDYVDQFNCGLMTVTEGARALTSVQTLIFGGYAAGTLDNPEEMMSKIGQLILTPWAANKIGDNMIFTARELLMAGYSEQDIREQMAKKFGSGALHPMFWFGPDWRKHLTEIFGSEIDTSTLDQVETLIDYIYVSTLGHDIYSQIVQGQHPDLDFLAEEEI